MYSFYESARSKKFGRTSANMYLQFKWDMENYATHRYNVKTAKPSIDNSAPRTFTHLYIRPKKLQLELERYSAIHRNNRFLLERLAKVHRDGAWIDDKNYHEIKSLNTWKRQQEMISLAHNNQIMLARLHDVGAGLNRHKLEDEYLMNQKHKANILKYPSNWREIREHLEHIKKETFKKVFDSKYRRKEYEKSRDKVLKRWAGEREKHEAERLARTSAPDEVQEAAMKRGRGDVAKGQKKALDGAQKKSSRPGGEKLKFDQRKPKAESAIKPPTNGELETQRKMYSTPFSETARGSTGKRDNVANKGEVRGKPNKARPASSTGFDVEGDSKSTKEEISDVDEHRAGPRENSQHPEIAAEEENEPSKGEVSENADFSAPSQSGKRSGSGVLSTTSEGSRRSEESEDSGSDARGRNYDSDSFEDETETELSDLGDEKTDYETENSASLDTSDSDRSNFESEANSDRYETSGEADDSKKEDDES